MKKALLINKGSADNLGDQAIRYVLERLLERNKIEVDFRDIVGEEEKKKRNYYASASKEIVKDKNLNFKRKIIRFFMKSSILKNLFWLISYNGIFNEKKFEKQYDLIIIGGGQLILSNSMFPMAMYRWSHFLNKNYKSSKKYIFGVGAVDSFNKFEKYLYNKSFEVLNGIYIRDYHSIATIKKSFNRNALYVPDVAFYISKVYENRVEKENNVIIGITDYLVYTRYNKERKSKEEYYTVWANYVLEFREKKYKTELFYTTTRDLSESLNFQKWLKNNYSIDIEIIYVNNLEELIDEIAKASIVISGRMHALIIGYAYKCNVIPYVISNKIKSFKEEYVDSERKIEDIQTEILENFNKVIGSYKT